MTTTLQGMKDSIPWGGWFSWEEIINGPQRCPNNALVTIVRHVKYRKCRRNHVCRRGGHAAWWLHRVHTKRIQRCWCSSDLCCMWLPQKLSPKGGIFSISLWMHFSPFYQWCLKTIWSGQSYVNPLRYAFSMYLL